VPSQAYLGTPSAARGGNTLLEQWAFLDGYLQGVLSGTIRGPVCVGLGGAAVGYLPGTEDPPRLAGPLPSLG
jgi:hypothetical protein